MSVAVCRTLIVQLQCELTSAGYFFPYLWTKYEAPKLLVLR